MVLVETSFCRYFWEHVGMLGLFLAGKTDKSLCQCPPSWKTTWKICKKICYSGYCSPKNWLISHRNMTRERKAWLVIKKERDLSIALNQGCQIKALGPEFHKTFYIFQRLQSLHNFQKMWKRTSILHFLQLYFHIMYVSHISFSPPIKTHHIDLVFSLSTVKKIKKIKKKFTVGSQQKHQNKTKKKKIFIIHWSDALKIKVGCIWPTM